MAFLLLAVVLALPADAAGAAAVLCQELGGNAGALWSLGLGACERRAHRGLRGRRAARPPALTGCSP